MELKIDPPKKLHTSTALCPSCGEPYLKSIGPTCKCKPRRRATKLPVSKISPIEEPKRPRGRPKGWRKQK